ncbi:hypothetical protein E3N88_27150 [Mikania micrantha]|uniref:Ubiquitin-like protease family profile domain-containing protein n=1 Tax=Mikania micrantha TaxID=192012 RepID=A0A5N6MVW0_9ASTR|nr:hypothetical protein E3N88_27150 [Mikania micrantha]
MGVLTSNRNKRDALCRSSPSGSDYDHLHIAKKHKSSPCIGSTKTSTSLVSRLSLYHQKFTPILRKIQVHCGFGFVGGFMATLKRWLANSRGIIAQKSVFLHYMRNALSRKKSYAKKSATGRCKHVRFEDENDSVEASVLKRQQIVPKYKELDQKRPSTSCESVSELTNRKMLQSLSLNQDFDGMDVDVDEPLHKTLLHEYNEKHHISLQSSKLNIKLPEAKHALHKQPSAAKKKKDVRYDPFRPLTEEEQEMIYKALSYSSRNEVLVTHANSNISITGEVLQCLSPQALLNDEVINVYLELLKERENRKPKKFIKCHFFNTFFYKKLISGHTGYDYKSVSRWTTQKKLGYSLLECDKIFVPIHKEMHWCLAVINKKEEKFQYLDSLGGADEKVLRMLAKYITDEVKDKTGECIDVASWEQEFVTDLPGQENGYDCGMFMIKYADFYSRGIGLCFSQEHMPYFRLRTAREILKLRAN